MADVGSLDSEQLLVLLQEIGKAADKIKNNVVGMGEASTKHMKNAGEAAAGMDKQIVSMTKNLLGPIGLVAGFTAAAKSLDQFAVGQLQLSNLARNTGLAASSVLNLQTKMQLTGLSVGEANAAIGGFASSLDNIKIFKEGSPIFQQISQGSQGLANTVLGFEKMGERMKSLEAIQKSYNAGNADWKLYLEQIFHANATVMSALKEDLTGVVMLTHRSDEETKIYHKTWVSLGNIATNVWEEISSVAIRELLKITGGMKGLETSSKEFTENIKQYFEDMKIGEIIEREMKTIRQLQSFMEYIGKLTEGRQFAPGPKAGPPGSLTAEEFLKREREKGGIDSDQLPKGARPRSYSGTGDVDSDSNKMLHDIRDMMQRSEIRQAGAGGSGGGGGSSGGGGSGPIFRQGIGGMGGTRGNRNNNRGNIKFGEFAKSMGATHADERGFAVFPDQATGDAAHTALLKQPQYQNLTLDEFGNKYSEGNADWKKTVGKSLGIGPNDKVDTSDPRLLEGIRKAEGTDSSGRGAIPSVILEQAKKAALGGGPNAVFNYIRGQGYNVDSAWCGDFAAAVVKAAGGTPPRNPQVASNWRNYGQEVDAPQPGDIAVRRGARTGDTGSHVTVVESVGKGRFVGVGGNQGRPESQFATNRFQFYRDEAAKEGLDKSMRSASVTGELNANVNFSNVPPGVKTNADGKGFKTLRVTASKQGQKAAEGLMSPGSMEYTPWVP